MVAFPLGKLIYLGIRQLSKPIAVQLRSSAAKHPFVSRYVCAPPAQILHRLEVFVRFRLMGMKGKAEFKALSEERAVELGSEILGEAFLYSVAAAFIVYEYWNSMKKEQMKEDDQNLHILELQEQTAKLEQEVAGLAQMLEGLREDLSVATTYRKRQQQQQQTTTAAVAKSKSWWFW